MLEILKDEEVCSGCGNGTNFHIHEGSDGDRFAYCKVCDGNMEIEYINTNNEYILEELEHEFKTVKYEQNDNFNWYDNGHYSKKALVELRERLEIGANTYGENVPISDSECLQSDRDNQSESMLEILDALVYQQAAYARDKEYLDKEGKDVIVVQFHSRILSRLVEIYHLQCKVTERMSNKINVNNRKGI
jgi:hypothetical protein